MLSCTFSLFIVVEKFHGSLFNNLIFWDGSINVISGAGGFDVFLMKYDENIGISPHTEYK